jgi:putative membrane protein
VPSTPWPRSRLAVFAAGAVLVVLAELPPLERLTFELLSAHLLQNVVLAEWAPALLVFGLPTRTGRDLSRYAPPFLVLPVWLANYFAWHLPPAYDAALRHPDTLLHVEHACYVFTGFLFWLPVAYGALSYGAKAAYVFAAFVLASPLGLLLALLPSAVYDFYDGHWGLSALTDQQIAGVTMASEQALVFFAVFAFYFLRFLEEER